MRKPVAGMTENDYPILAFLTDHDIALSPSNLQHNLATREHVDIPDSTINRRLKKLLHGGLLEQENGTYYSITELGRRRLAGELTDDERAELERKMRDID